MGSSLVKITSKQIQHAREPIVLQTQIPLSDEIVMSDALAKMCCFEPAFATFGMITLLELQVIKPAVVRVEGVWRTKNGYVIISKRQVAFIKPGLARPLSIVGDGEATLLSYRGPVNSAMFDFARRSV
jgi:hypothetical protein